MRECFKETIHHSRNVPLFTERIPRTLHLGHSMSFHNLAPNLSTPPKTSSSYPPLLSHNLRTPPHHNTLLPSRPRTPRRSRILMRSIFIHILRIPFQNDKSLENTADRDIFFRCEFGTFAVSDEDGRGMGLEACDCFGATGLADCVDCLAYSDCYGEVVELFV